MSDSTAGVTANPGERPDNTGRGLPPGRASLFSMAIAKRLSLLLLVVLALGGAFVWPARADREVIRLATWNLEWLVAPGTAHQGRLRCRSGRQSALPCDVVQDLSRDSADFARLASYARQLDADVVAFQEVEDEATARRVFPGYLICMADGPGLQHVGFAVRPHLTHHCGPAVDSLAMGGRSRKAMSMQMTLSSGAPMMLLAVHLKSGCSRDPIDSDSAACRLLAQQAALLGEWVAAREADSMAFVVMGDFNRVTPEDADDPFWSQVMTAPSQLLAAGLPFTNCLIGHPYSAFIDHMLFSQRLQHRLLPATARHMPFRSADGLRYRLSDHCPVSISLNLGDMAQARDQ